MAELAIQEVSETGINPTFAAADVNGDTFPNDDRTILVVKNGDASPHTATLQVQRAGFKVTQLGDITFADIAVAVPAGEERYVKAPVGPYNDGNGKVHVTYDAVTSVTVAALKAPQD